MKNEIEAWWKVAQDDFEKAKILFNAKKYDGAAFYSQQAVEKALKALLIKKTGKIRKIHDLGELGKDLSVPADILDRLKELTVAYIYSRYPDLKQETELKTIVSDFFKVVEEVFTWVEENL